MTRSVTSLVRGDLAAAWGYHPAGPILVVAMAVVVGLRVGDKITGRTVLAGARAFWDRIATGVLVVLVMLLFGLWAVRLYGELGIAA